MKSWVNRIPHAHICQVTGSNHLECYFLIFSWNNIHSKSLRTKPDTFFFSPQSFSVQLNLHRVLWNFQLPRQFGSQDCNSSGFPPRKVPAFHTTTTLPQKQSENTPKYCTVLFTGHRQEMDPSVPSATPWNRNWWSWDRDARKRWSSRALRKETAPAGHKGWNAGLWAAWGGTDHQCHWLSKSKNRTILRQVPKQGAIYSLGTISSYASRLLLYPFYGQ